MKTIRAFSASDAWTKTIKYILRYGRKRSGIIECLNVAIEITDFREDKVFDKKFRKIFGDERIDYAASVTFVEPEEHMLGTIYAPIGDHWYDSYFGRMIAYRGRVNQIKNAIKILKTKKNVKRCEIIIYEPEKDMKQMFKQPCLLAIDIKPRNGKIHLTAFFRSQRVSKSGYADYSALIALGKHLAKESENKLFKVTIIATSCHVNNDNKELDKSKLLISTLRRNGR
ncbi:MAG: thymidylate synthase [Candidatus Hodarchaeales archaeon]|jgi:thymidylate synthase